MATTAVSICNIALLRVGQAKTITTLSGTTPEALACNAFYELARNALLTELPWQFSTARQLLGLIASGDDVDDWEYAYALPPDCLLARYLDTGVPETSQPVRTPFVLEEAPAAGAAYYVLPFDSAIVANEPTIGNVVTGDGGAAGTLVANSGAGETSGVLIISGVSGVFVDNEWIDSEYATVNSSSIAGGGAGEAHGAATSVATTGCLLTDKEDAQLVYSKLETNPAKFPALFVDALAWRLASDLALAIPKKPALAEQMMKMYVLTLARAGSKELTQQDRMPEPDSPIILGR